MLVAPKTRIAIIINIIKRRSHMSIA